MKKINFNKDWSFRLNEGEETKISLPHDFSIIQKRLPDAKSNQHGGFFQGGLGEYKKTFKAKKNKKYFFMCDGSFGLTEIYVNYNSVFINKYPYNTFYVDITDFLRYDKENLITVVVNNRHQPNARWYTGAGIYRDTYLLECGNTYFSPLGIFVKTDSIQNDTAYLTVSTGSGATSRNLLHRSKMWNLKSSKTILFFSKRLSSEKEESLFYLQ